MGKRIPNLFKTKFIKSIKLSEKQKAQISKVNDTLYLSADSNTRSYIRKYVEDFLKNDIDSWYMPRIRRLLRRTDKSATNLYVWILKYGKSNGLNLFNDYNQKRAVTLSNMILKYGADKGKDKFEKYKNKQRYVGVDVRYFIEKYGREQGTLIHADVCKKKANNIENIMRRRNCTEEEAANILVKMHRGGNASASKKSQKFIEAIDEIITDLYPDVNTYYFNKHGKEFIIYDKKFRKARQYDYVITSPINIIIEYDGDYWHANPQKYKPRDMIRGLIAEEIWALDEHKNSLAESRGFEIIRVWESDVSKDFDRMVDKVVQYIRNR